jgi:hypothetical protein
MVLGLGMLDISVIKDLPKIGLARFSPSCWGF